MGAKLLFIVATCAMIAPSTVAFNTENNKPQNASSADVQERKYSMPNFQGLSFKTDQLINQQSENVRHIIATEQRHQAQRERQDDLKQVKKEKAIVTIEDERFPTLEELRAKCQHFSRLFGLSQSGSMENYENSDAIERHSTTLTPSRPEYYSRPTVEITRRPVYIRNKPTFIQKNNGGFYVTASTTGNAISSTKKPFWTSSTAYPKVTYTPTEYSRNYPSSTPTPPTTPKMTTTFYISNPIVRNVTESVHTTTTSRPKIKIKYTKFEPVILQKTILTDGRVMYHWHRSLPTAAVDLPAPIVQQSAYEYPSIPATMPWSQRNLGPYETTTMEPTTSTTTTEKSSWLFVPFSSLFGGSNDEETTMAESNTPTPSTTSTTDSIIIGSKLETDSSAKLSQLHSNNEEAKLAQLKLVVPVHYDDIDASLAAQNNRLLYYRKAPDSINQGGSSPALQVIKTLGVPQNIPRYSLGYTGTGYGLTYGRPYSPAYLNYQAYNGPLEREDKTLEDVSVQK